MVRLALERLDGVKEAKVSLGKQTAWVAYEPKKVTVQQMIEAIKRSGYGAEVIPPGGG